MGMEERVQSVSEGGAGGGGVGSWQPPEPRGPSVEQSLPSLHEDVGSSRGRALGPRPAERSSLALAQPAPQHVACPSSCGWGERPLGHTLPHAQSLQARLVLGRG